MKRQASIVIISGVTFATAACLFPNLDELSTDDASSDAVVAIDASNDASVGDGDASDASVRCVEPVSAQLIAHWPIDEGTGTTVSDCSGKHAGVITGDVTWITNSTGLDFGGSGLVAITPSVAFHVSDFTSTAEIRATSVDIPSYLGQIVGSNDSWGMYLVQGLGFAMTIYDATGNDLGWLPPPQQNLPLSDGGASPWISVATVLRNGAQREIWISGALVNQDVVEAGTFTSPAAPEVSLGAYEGSFQRKLVGQVRNVRIFSRALDAAEIQTLAAL